MEVRPDLLEQLLCSLCGGYLSCAPVRMKTDGSILCGRCGDPEDKSALRITPYELVAQMLMFPCTNKPHGCSKSLNFGEVKEHEDECKYRQYVCPLTKTGQCDWSGAMKDILAHCHERHADNLHLTAEPHAPFTQNTSEISEPPSTEVSNAALPANSETIYAKVFKTSSDYKTEPVQHFEPDPLEISEPPSAETLEDALPAKSKAIYEKVFKTFVDWKSENAVTEVTESVMMSYFLQLSEKYTPNSLWSKYSILKSTLLVNDNVDLARFKRLVTFLKQRSKGYVPKKSKVLTGDQVMTFLANAPNDTYLLHKVVLVMGVFGGLKREEMVKMTIDQIEDKGCVLLVNIPQARSGETKAFAIMEEHELNALQLVRHYITLRPRGLAERRFFLTYRNGYCTTQPVGKNSLGSVPSVIAKYLKLANAGEYTGHCLRQMSTKWKNNTTTGATAESLGSRVQMTRMISGGATPDEDTAMKCEEFAQVTIKEEFY